MIPYEFSDEKLEFDLVKVEQNLNLLKKLGHQNYGMTVRPIRSVMELETEGGHVYRPMEEFQDQEGKISETATRGPTKLDWCSSSSYCTGPSSNGYHGKTWHH